MSPAARLACSDAMEDIERGDYRSAINELRSALRGTSNRKAWSKLMLAIRELSRIAQ